MKHRIALLLGLALLAGACTAAGPQPTPQFTSMNPAWPNWFTLDVTTDGGARRLSGYVHNGYGEEATAVQLLTQALDASGSVVGHRITWAGNVPPLSRTYFEVRDLPAAQQYKVTVWAFTFNLKDGWD